LKEYAEKNIDVQLVQATNESKFNVLSRLADEYETLNRIPQANKHYKELMSLNPSDHASLNQYALFALRAGNFQNAEDLLEKALSFNNTNRDYQLLLAAVYL
jgi:tetratricopeptide (TPR) repeat protein